MRNNDGEASKNKIAKARAELAIFHKVATSIVRCIAKERDRLRRIMADYADALECCHDAKEDFERGLDRISEVL